MRLTHHNLLCPGPMDPNPGVRGARRQMIGSVARNPDFVKLMNNAPGRDRTLENPGLLNLRSSAPPTVLPGLLAIHASGSGSGLRQPESLVLSKP